MVNNAIQTRELLEINFRNTGQFEQKHWINNKKLLFTPITSSICIKTQATTVIDISVTVK